ncbi:DUF2946 family protein [Bradyrhizobium sp. STM 3562]|uniref:DUF2946 family protein n=1 Tax=Bradyrhizobium sp. STM 3562 TaxID=578924 RepID=UPI00388F7E95
MKLVRLAPAQMPPSPRRAIGDSVGRHDLMPDCHSDPEGYPPHRRQSERRALRSGVMKKFLTQLRSGPTRVVVAWAVAFGLLLQTLLPVLALHARAQALADPDFGIICSGSGGDHSDQAGGPKPLDDAHPNDCCSICVLIHASHLAVPPQAAADVFPWPAQAQAIQISRDHRGAVALAFVPYSSRAPPPAS